MRLDAGTYVRLSINPAPVDLVVSKVGPEGSSTEQLRIPGGGDEPRHLSWIITAGGEHRWIVAPREPSGLPGCCALAVEEERVEGPCDEAVIRTERAVLGAQWELNQPHEDVAAGARARELMAPALAGAAEVGDLGKILSVSIEMARAAQLMGSGDAASLIDRASEMAHSLGDSRGEAKALEERAQLLPAAAAVATLLKALELQSGSETGQSVVLHLIGSYYFYLLRDTGRALQSYQRALELQWRNDDSSGQSWTMGELGVLYGLQGDADRAHDYLEFAFDRGKAAGDIRAQASALEGSARFDLELGDLQAAYDKYDRARKLTLSSVNTEAAWALNGLARVLLYLGEAERARQLYGEALKDFEALNLAGGRADTQLGIGSVFEQKGDLNSALNSFQKALEVIRNAGLPRLEGLALYDLGKAHRELKQPSQAIPELEAALALGVNDSPVKQAQTQVELANAYTQAGKAAAAESAFQQAIRLSVRAPLVEAAAQAGLARIERDRGELAAARAAIQRALEITEHLREGVLRPDQRVSFLASRRSYYEFLVDLLMRFDRFQPGAGHAAEAVVASEQARARGLLDMLAGEQVDVRRGIPPELKRHEEEIGIRIARLQKRLLSSASLALPDQEISRLDRELVQAEEEEKDLDAELRRRQPAYAALRPPGPLALHAMQGLLDEHTALLEFFLGEESSYLFVVTDRALFTFVLPPKQEIARLVARVSSAVYEDTRLGSRHFAEDAYELYRLLLLPAARELRGKRDLIVAPDGRLYSLSFEVLLTRSRLDSGVPRRDFPYLIREHSVSYVPSAGVLSQLLSARRPRDERRSDGRAFIGFGDPGQRRPPGVLGAAVSTGDGCELARSGEGEGRDTRLTGAAGAGPMPLPAARDEVCRIARLFPADQATVFTGADATEDAVKTNALVASASNLHFASHGLLDESHPELSGLQLTHAVGSAEDGLLQVREIYNLNLHADLVVLSACQTGLGKEVSGEGVIGMARAFFYAGAGSVVVSLWKVADEATADLMVSFYRHFQQVGDKSEALRLAKLELIDRSQYSHPYFWAPFVLIGRPR